MNELARDRHAAKKLGLTKSTFYRIRAKQALALSRTVAVRLEKAACAHSPDLEQAFLAAMISPEAVQLRETYKRWVTKWHEAFCTPSVGLLRHQLKPEHRERLDDFQLGAKKQGHTQKRHSLSVGRILKPFTESLPSGQVERTWSELDDSERARYLKAAIICEKILLNRPRDAERARMAAARRRDQILLEASAEPRSFDVVEVSP